MAANKINGCDGTMCPGGCCPEKNWQCCPDGVYCAETMDDCPKRNLKKMLVGMAANKINDCDGTMCPGGCCPEKNWQCCPDGVYCAETMDDCPKRNLKKMLVGNVVLTACSVPKPWPTVLSRGLPWLGLRQINPRNPGSLCLEKNCGTVTGSGVWEGAAPTRTGFAAQTTSI